MKNRKFSIITALLAAVALLSALPARANLQTQTDTNVLASASTNTYRISGDVSGTYTNGQAFNDSQVIDGTKTSQLTFMVGGFFTNSTANSSNVIYRISQSVDGANWTNAAISITLTIPANTTNWVNAQYTPTTIYPLYSLRAVENANANSVAAKSGTVFLKAFTKTGL